MLYIFAGSGGIGDVLGFQQGQGRQRSGNRDRVATKCGGVRAGRPVHDIGAADDGAERKAGGDAFGGA